MLKRTESSGTPIWGPYKGLGLLKIGERLYTVQYETKKLSVEQLLGGSASASVFSLSLLKTSLPFLAQIPRPWDYKKTKTRKGSHNTYCATLGIKQS